MKICSYDSLFLLFLIFGYMCFLFRRTKYCVGKVWLNAMLFLSFEYMFIMIGMSKYDNGLFFISAAKPMVYVYLANVIAFLPLLVMYFLELCGERLRFPWVFFVIPLIESGLLISNEKTHLLFSLDRDRGYLSGRMMWLIYASYILYYLLITVMVYVHRRRLGRKTCTGILIIIAFEAVLQLVQRSMHCNLYGLALSVFLIFIMTMVYMADNHFDDLTEAFNRKGFYYTASELIHMNRDKKYLIVRLDVINFQDVNERFGNAAGDMILHNVAAFLKKKMTRYSALGYFGADDFVACMPEEEFQIYAMHSGISHLHPGITENYDLSYSVGVYRIEDTDMDMSLMCDRADFAMNSLEKNSREHLQFFDDVLDKKFTMEKYIVHEMYHALANGCFEVYIQPIVDTATRQIVSGEALARWKDEKYGMISPGVFIPVFEKNGFVSDLDRYVLNRVCMYISARKTTGRKIVPLSVNLSRMDLKILSLADTIHDIVNGYGLTPDEIKLEVTESAFEKENEQFILNIGRMHRLGYKILMDDFGSGYSNFNTFSRMPVDILKADMGFMSELESSDKGTLIMKNILNMTHELSIPVIVEGVETDNQYEFLRELKCEQIQGYYFSKPVPIVRFSELLDMGNI